LYFCVFLLVLQVK